MTIGAGLCIQSWSLAHCVPPPQVAFVKQTGRPMETNLLFTTSCATFPASLAEELTWGQWKESKRTPSTSVTCVPLFTCLHDVMCRVLWRPQWGQWRETKRVGIRTPARSLELHMQCHLAMLGITGKNCGTAKATRFGLVGNSRGDLWKLEGSAIRPGYDSRRELVELYRKCHLALLGIDEHVELYRQCNLASSGMARE